MTRIQIAERNSLIIAAIKEGTKTYAQIAKEFSISDNYVSTIAKNAGITKVEHISPEQVSEMQRLRTEGMSNEMIARRMGCTGETVRLHIGNQPKEITEAYKKAAGAIRRARTAARNVAKLAMEEARRAEEARLEAQRRESMRQEKEFEIRCILDELKIPSENIHIDSAEQGLEILRTMNSLTSKYAA